MTPDSKLIDLTLAAFSERLAARTSTPGGGSLAAYAAACGAATASMACRFTSGEKHAAVEAAMAARAERLDKLRARALELVDEDSAAYDAVTGSFQLPKATEDQKAERRAAVQAAMKGALEVPFHTMQTAVEALRLAAEAAPELNPKLASDCGVGAACLATAVEGAFLNVRINAGSIKDEAFVTQRLKACEHVRAETRELVGRVQAAVERHLG